jgi:hypothetical protein
MITANEVADEINRIIAGTIIGIVITEINAAATPGSDFELITANLLMEERRSCSPSRESVASQSQVSIIP